MVRKLAFALIMASGAWAISGGLVAEAQAQQRAWCEENCRLMCRLTLRPGATPAQCYAYINCAQFKGRPCASEATVRQRSQAYCKQKGTCAK